LFAHNWIGPSIGRQIIAIATSRDGTRVAAAPAGGKIWTSINSGLTWTEQGGSPDAGWKGIASSADGMKLYAVADHIYRSTDGGVTWTSVGNLSWLGIPDSAACRTIACSADGTRVVAAGEAGSSAWSPHGLIWISSSSGLPNTWNAYGSDNNWERVKMSGDGQRLLAVETHEFDWYFEFYAVSTVQLSTDGGGSWNTVFDGGPLGSIPDLASVQDVACSEDCSKLVMTTFERDPLDQHRTKIRISNDSGSSWNERIVVNSDSWIGGALACTADFSRILAPFGYPGYCDQITVQPLVSGDSGISWLPVFALSAAGWYAAAGSADNNKLFIGGCNGVFVSLPSTTLGTGGSLLGGSHAAIELQYVGNGQWIPISHEGDITPH
jgi:hypothetical protein